MGTRISIPDVIHTNVERFLQQLTTALVAATSKRRGGTTGKRHQTTGHDGTSTPMLTPRLHFSWYVIAIRRPQGTITNAYEKSNLINCSEHCQKNTKKYTNLIYNPWEIFHHEWQRHHEKMDAPPQTHSGKTRKINNSISRTSCGLPGRIKY